ncbi:DUF1206 domain-containing protein [Methylopila henanensis]|uniref:DUF1206 domain-containing protein n=1 Tax=Methylopila henanensis TaxID=873516 RepID=A0ABW4K4I3_9HYPH
MDLHHASRIETLARLGFAARGLVYCLVGGLAVLAAIGVGGSTGGSRSALLVVLEQPFGAALLAAVGAGLVCFAAWRITSAVTDADGRGDSAKGRGVRALQALSGVVYLGLAGTAIGLAAGRGGGGGGEDQAAQDWTAWALAQPLGRWAIAAIGFGVVAGGFGYGWKAWRGDVTKRLSVPPDAMGWVTAVGRAGYAARGVTFLLIGGFLALAAWRADSEEVRGLGGALQALRAQPYGWVLLGLTAAGLFAFGLFGFVQARYRRIDAPDLDDARAALRKVV